MKQTQTIRFFHSEDDRTGTNYYGNAVIVDEIPKIGEEYDSSMVMEIGLRSWFASQNQNDYNIYELKGPEVPLYKLRDGIDPAPIFGDKAPRCIMDEEIDNLSEKLGRPELYKDFVEAEYSDIVEMGFDPFLITSRFVAVLSEPELETSFIDLTGGQDTGILIWKNPNANLFCGGRWEITVSYWNHMQYDTEIQYGDQVFDLDAPHKTTEADDLTEYLTNDNGELWASVEVDDDDDIPRLLEAHMPGTVYDYGNLVIVLPAEWN